MTRGKRKARRERLRELAHQRPEAEAHRASADRCEKRAAKPPASLTPKRLKFALLWAEADPEDSLADVARAAGYSESVAGNGYIAELCRDAAVIEVRDRRLAELQRVSGVTPEDVLVGLQALARDINAPTRDRVSAYKVILAWYSAKKGQHQPERKAGEGEGIDTVLARALAQQLGIPEKTE